MAEPNHSLKRRLTAVFGAFLIGFIAVIIGVAWLDSRLVVGIALFGLTAVVLYAWLAFRCPLCGASVFNSPAGAALRWVRGPERRCPRCRTDYEAALREVSHKH